MQASKDISPRIYEGVLKGAMHAISEWAEIDLCPNWDGSIAVLKTAAEEQSARCEVYDAGEMHDQDCASCALCLSDLDWEDIER